jgi:hypothetical protein
VPVYLALIHRIPGCEYRIQFPDFPGVEARTAEFNEVRDEAKRSLFDEIQRRGDCRESLPRPTKREELQLEDLQLEPSCREGLLLPIEVEKACADGSAPRLSGASKAPRSGPRPA